MRKLYVEYQQL